MTERPVDYGRASVFTRQCSGVLMGNQALAEVGGHSDYDKHAVRD